MHQLHIFVVPNVSQIPAISIKNNFLHDFYNYNKLIYIQSQRIYK